MIPIALSVSKSIKFGARKASFPMLLLLAGSSLFAAAINLNTGVAAWQGSGPNVSGTVTAADLGTAPNSIWLPAPSGSSWISTQPTDGILPPDASGMPGTYTFTLSFATPGNGGSLDYTVAADNQTTVVVQLDGVTISTFSHPGNTQINLNGSPGCAFLPNGNSQCTPGVAQGVVGPGAIFWNSGGAGVISILATVVNSTPPDPSPIGFLLVGSANPTPSTNLVTPTPEPSAFLMLSMGTLALLAARRRLRF